MRRNNAEDAPKKNEMKVLTNSLLYREITDTKTNNQEDKVKGRGLFDEQIVLVVPTESDKTMTKNGAGEMFNYSAKDNYFLEFFSQIELNSNFCNYGEPFP